MSNPPKEPQPGRAALLQTVTAPLVLIGALALMILATLIIGSASRVTGGWTERPPAVYGFASLCTMLSLWLILGAVFAYVNIGQAKKIEIITGFYTPDTIADYFDQFWSGRDGIAPLVKAYRGAAKMGSVSGQGQGQDLLAKAAADLDEKFRSLFADDFGLAAYVVPILIMVAAAGIVLFLGYVGGINLSLSYGHTSTSAIKPLGVTLDLVSVAAIFGAFTWVTSDVIVRNHQWTLHPSDLSWYALRFVIAVPLGQALALTVDKGAATSLPEGAGAFLAFAASMFSLDAITKALGTAATRFGVKLSNGDDERNDLVVKLAGVDEDKARALKGEGVSTIAQLTTVDPIRTSIRSGLPFEFVTKLVDSALLWEFVGEALPPLRPLGIRGAADLLALNQSWEKAAAEVPALVAVQAASQTLQGAQKAAAVAIDSLAAAGMQMPPIAGAVEAAQREFDTRTADVRKAADEVAKASAGLGDAFGPVAPVVADKASMVAALQVKTSDGGPGLTAVGFATIVARLQDSSYAGFVRRLLDQ